MNEIEPLLREAMSRVPRPVDARASITDVRRRARRRNHRRMTATAGALACTGVATTALILRRDVPEPSAVGTTATTDTAATTDSVVTTTIPVSDEPTRPTMVPTFEGIMLIDGGAPAGAMDDLYQRLTGYNRTIVPGSGKTVEQTIVMPIDGNDALAGSVAGVLGIDGLDTWDPSFLGTLIEGLVAVVVGPDYWDRVGGPATAAVTTTNVVLDTSG